MGFFADVGPLQVFVSSHVSIPPTSQIFMDLLNHFPFDSSYPMTCDMIPIAHHHVIHQMIRYDG